MRTLPLTLAFFSLLVPGAVAAPAVILDTGGNEPPPCSPTYGQPDSCDSWLCSPYLGCWCDGQPCEQSEATPTVAGTGPSVTLVCTYNDDGGFCLGTYGHTCWGSACCYDPDFQGGCSGDKLTPI